MQSSNQQISKLETELRNIKITIETDLSTIREEVSKTISLEGRIAELENKLDELDSEKINLQLENEALRERMVRSEYNHRIRNLIFFGIKESGNSPEDELIPIINNLFHDASFETELKGRDIQIDYVY